MIRKLILALVLALSVPALGQVPKSTIITDIGTFFPDQSTGAITPAIQRSFLTTLTNSFQQYAGVNPQAGTSYAIATSDYGQLVTFNNASSVAVTIPQATGLFQYFSVFVKNIGAGTVTITPTTSTINGASNVTLAQNAGLFIVSDGTNYQTWGGIGGSGVTSVALTMPAVFTVGGSPIINTGTFAVAGNGTSGGVVCFTSSTVMASSGALTANVPVIGGGAGSCPSSGTRSGNTTEFGTVNGSTVSGDCAKWDASGNLVDNGSGCSGGSGAVIIPPQGRLTLVTGTPVMIVSEVNKATLYYDCYNGGNLVPYYTGAADATEGISGCEVSTGMQASSTGVLNTSSVFDVWWVHSGTNRICVATNGSGGGWASDTGGSNTARGSGYSQLDTTSRAYITNKNSISHCYNATSDYGSISANQATYLGTIYTTAAGQTGISFNPSAGGGGSATIVGLFNAYNRVRFSTSSRDNSSTWAYSGGSWRLAHNSASNSISYIDGLQVISPSCLYTVTATGSGTMAVGCSMDWSSGSPGGSQGSIFNPGAQYTSMTGSNTLTPMLGFHVIDAVEGANSTGGTFVGSGLDTVPTGLQTQGLTATLEY